MTYTPIMNIVSLLFTFQYDKVTPVEIVFMHRR